jgi:hypothetical protein
MALRNTDKEVHEENRHIEQAHMIYPSLVLFMSAVCCHEYLEAHNMIATVMYKV